ncbi:MAG: cytochrome c, partial [Paracoccaceae bacterium]|nr:cytochrome c [Paracoccaceae bacterium]
MKELLIWLGLISGPAVIFAVFGTSGMDAFDDQAAARTSSAMMGQGRTAFARHCASCHGRMARGTSHGPGLLGTAFGVSAMPDGDIRSAVLEGVPTENYAYRPLG